MALLDPPPSAKSKRKKKEGWRRGKTIRGWKFLLFSYLIAACRLEIPAQIKTPAVGSTTAGRESGGCWERAVLEICRVRALTSRVALRGATGGRPDRCSTGRLCSIEGRSGELLPHVRRKDSLSPSTLGPLNLPQSCMEDAVDAVDQVLVRSDVSRMTSNRQWELGKRLEEFRKLGATGQLKFPATLRVMRENRMYNIGDPYEADSLLEKFENN
ncbi:hypothetical protein NDU88_004000 [Pleurodeles waltl]|uniref:Uncharacterized protein n=1 Tax=Pleurodeles waltl TaxID=8319 RepID=A0AAV7NI52_PLEWA|nr:hypothetical protein NDU88_004000 [Pleurodeles waltl]